MKRIFCLMLVFAMIATTASCSSSLEPEENTETTEVTQEVTLTEEEKETGPIIYPDTFSAGFSRACVTPSVDDLPIMTNGGSQATYGYSIKSDLYVTCVAVCDGENVALLYNFDMKEIQDSFEKQGKKILSDAFGIPAENVIFNATHSHTAPHGDSPAVTKFTKACFAAIESCAEEAMRDLAPAEIYTGRGDSTGLAFVRRYVMADGTYQGIHSANPSLDYVSHESIADPELRTVRFDRGDKKDIVMANWQCHAASDASLLINGKTVVSADFVDKLRFGVEEEMDVHFAYFNGASGNINMVSKIESEQICSNTDELGEALVDVVKEALQNETKVASGPIHAAKSSVVATVRKDYEERIAAHYAAQAESGVEASYYHKGIQSYYDEIHLNERKSLPETQEIPLYAISFGDIAFAGAPYEMCDGSGMEIRAGANYNTTFTCGYTGGHMGYMATDDMFPNGEYEVYSCRYVSGTAELCANELVRMLNLFKEAA